MQEIGGCVKFIGTKSLHETCEGKKLRDKHIFRTPHTIFNSVQLWFSQREGKNKSVKKKKKGGGQGRNRKKCKYRHRPTQNNISFPTICILG